MELTPFSSRVRDGGLCFDGMRGVVEQHGDGATGEARFGRVGAAGEDGGNARAEDDAGELRAAEVLKLLGEHVAAFEIGNDEDVGLAGDGRDELLDGGGLER